MDRRTFLGRAAATVATALAVPSIARALEQLAPADVDSAFLESMDAVLPDTIAYEGLRGSTYDAWLVGCDDLTVSNARLEWKQGSGGKPFPCLHLRSSVSEATTRPFPARSSVERPVERAS